MVDLIGPTLSLVVLATAFVFGVIWLVLPFALFGIKPRLDRQARELARVRAALERLSAPPTIAAGEITAPCQSCGVGMAVLARVCPNCGGARDGQVEPSGPGRIGRPQHWASAPRSGE